MARRRGGNILRLRIAQHEPPQQPGPRKHLVDILATISQYKASFDYTVPSHGSCHFIRFLAEILYTRSSAVSVPHPMLSTALCNFEPTRRYRRRPVAILNPEGDIAAGLLLFETDKSISPQACCEFEPKWRCFYRPIAILTQKSLPAHRKMWRPDCRGIGG